MTSRPGLLYLMKQVEQAVRAGLDDVVRPWGVTALQYTAMTVLERNPDMTSAHLARHSFVTAQSMADMVKGLLDRGLVERRRDPDDRRRLVLSLTNDGRRLLAECRGPVAQLEARLLRGLDRAQTEQLRSTMEHCRANMRPDHVGR